MDKRQKDWILGKNALKVSKRVRINTTTAKIEIQTTKGIGTKISKEPVKLSKNEEIMAKSARLQ